MNHLRGDIAGQAACKYLIKTVCSVNWWALKVRERATNELPSPTTQVCNFGLKHLSNDWTQSREDLSRLDPRDVKEAAPQSVYSPWSHDFPCCRIITLTLLYLLFGWTGSLMTMAPSTTCSYNPKAGLASLASHHHEVHTSKHDEVLHFVWCYRSLENVSLQPQLGFAFTAN